jgi:hypothetical protein
MTRVRAGPTTAATAGLQDSVAMRAESSAGPILAHVFSEEFAAALNRAVEEMILSAPQHDSWLHERYRKAPPAS